MWPLKKFARSYNRLLSIEACQVNVTFCFTELAFPNSWLFYACAGGLCQPVICANRVSRLAHRSGALISFPAFPLLGSLSLDCKFQHSLGKIRVFQEPRDFLRKLFFSGIKPGKVVVISAAKHG